MPVNSIKYIMSNDAVHALFITLVHSLWQGILAALIAAVILLNTKKSGAILRYKLLCATLLLFTITSGVTFFCEINLLTHNRNEIFTAASVVTVTHDTTNTNLNSGFAEKVIFFFKSGENFIMMAWFVIIMLKSVSLLTGLQRIYVLKRKQVFDAGLYWNNKLKELAVKTGVTKPVVLFKSAIAEMPMVIGHLKPIILFPVAAFTTLPPEEIEAILLHELAHIRRKDYLVNILQSLAEIIFFFNPAVLWISSLIKNERENCCDDIAVHYTKNKKQFIHALVAFQEHNSALEYAASFSNNKMHLLNRIKRIITNNNKTLNNMEKIFLASGIIITVFATVAFTKIKQPHFTNAGHVIEQVKSNLFINKKDTTEPTVTINDESKTVINNSVNGKQYKLIETNGKTELYVDGVKVPDNKMPDYKNVIAKLKQQIVIDKKNQDEAMKAQAEAIKENDVAMEAQENAEKLNELKAMIDDSVKSNLSNEQVEALKDQAEELKEQAVKMKADIKNEISDTEVKEYKAVAETYAKQATAMKAEMQSSSARMKAEALKAQTEYMNQQNLMNKAALDQQMEQLKTAQKKLVEQSEIMKQQQEQMKAEMDKQANIMKQQQIQMKADMEKQVEQLKVQREEMIKQMNIKKDSINTVEPVKPNK